MPRIIAIRRGATVGADLSVPAFRLGLAATQTPEPQFCFSLCFWYPPATSFAFRPADSSPYSTPPAMMTLLQVPISLADNEGELSRVAEVSLGSNNQEADIARMTEAYQLFRNKPRTIAGARLDACVRDSAEVIKAYYSVQAWMVSGMKETAHLRVTTSYAQREGETMESTLVCQP